MSNSSNLPSKLSRFFSSRKNLLLLSFGFLAILILSNLATYLVFKANSRQLSPEKEAFTYTEIQKELSKEHELRVQAQKELSKEYELRIKAQEESLNQYKLKIQLSNKINRKIILVPAEKTQTNDCVGTHCGINDFSELYLSQKGEKEVILQRNSEGGKGMGIFKGNYDLSFKQGQNCQNLGQTLATGTKKNSLIVFETSLSELKKQGPVFLSLENRDSNLSFCSQVDFQDLHVKLA